MAGHYPFAYFDESTTANDYGGTDTKKNIHYRIHDNSNNPLFTSDGSIDVYKFSETDSSGSPERSYALIIIKNVGAHQSLLNCTGITLNTQSENTANFSLVTSLSQITSGVDFDGSGGEVGFLSPAEYQSTVLNALSGTDLTAPEPLGYLKLNTSSGTIEEGDFSGSTKYIPFYSPLAITNSSYDISADNFGGSVVYSQYAAFLLKCDPNAPANITSHVETETLVLDFNIGQSVKFYLNVDSFSEGALGYQHGSLAIRAGGGRLFTAKNSVVSVKDFTSVTSSQADLNPTRQNAFLSSMGNFSDRFTNNVTNHVFLGYQPIGYTAEDADMNGITAAQVIRIHDTSGSTGGIRLQFKTPDITDGIFDVDVTRFVQPTDLLSMQVGSFTDFSYNYYPDYNIGSANDLILNESSSTLFLNSSNTGAGNSFTMSEHQNVYLVLSKRSEQTTTGFYNTDDRLGLTSAHINTSTNNWRPKAYTIPIVFNKFYINGSSGETTQIDYLEVFHGTYKSLATSSTTLTAYCPNPLSQVAALQVFSSISDNFTATSRINNLLINRNVLGKQASSYSGIYKEKNQSTDRRIDVNTDSLVRRAGEEAVARHHHIKDMFVLPYITLNSGLNVEVNNIDFTYINANGADKFFCQDFPWIDSDEDPVVVRNAGSTTDSSSFNPISVSNRANFRPSGINTTDNSNISGFRTVFAAGSTDGGAYTAFNNKFFPSTAKQKSVKLKLKYSPASKNALSSPSSIVDAYKNDSNIDALGRLTESTTIKISQGIADVVAGGTQTLNSNTVIASETTTSEFIDTSIEFNLFGQCWPEYFVRYKNENSFELAGPVYMIGSKLIDTTLYSTEYLANALVGGHTVANDTRPALNGLTLSDIVQETSLSSNVLNVNGALSSTTYFSQINHSESNYYKRNPLSGQFAFKYERYFNQDRYDNATSGNFLPNFTYGLLPGPLLPGRYDAAGDNAISAYTKREKMFHDTAAYNSSAGTYECFIPIDFENYSHYPINIISVQLDNEVGDASQGLSGMSDPRFMFGSGSMKLSSGAAVVDKGLLYETSISDNASTAVKASTTDHIVKTSCSASGTTALTVPNTNNIYVGQRVFSETSGFIAAGTTVTAIANSTTVTLSAAAGTASSQNVLFDSKHKDYATWNLVRGSRGVSSTDAISKFPVESNLDVTANVTLNSSTSITAVETNASTGLYAQANGSNLTSQGYIVTPNALLVGSLVIGDGIPEGTTVTATSSNTVTISAAATVSASKSIRFVHIDRLTVSSDFITRTGVDPLTKIGDNDLALSFEAKSEITPEDIFSSKYDDPDSLTTGMPHIYFGVDASKLSENNFDTGTYYNIVRIKYILWDNVDMYGVAQRAITSTTATKYDFKTSNANQAHVYEDVYLVKVDFTNLLPEIQVSDIEGDTHNNLSVINFNTIRAS